MSEDLTRAVALLPPPTRSRVWRAWALTLAGRCDRTGKDHYDPEWWAAWLSATLWPWYRGCRPMAPFRDRTPRVPLVPRYDVDEAVERLLEARTALSASVQHGANGYWRNTNGPAQTEAHLMDEAVRAHAYWLNRRQRPLREQVALLLVLDAVHDLALTPLWKEN